MCFCFCYFFNKFFPFHFNTSISDVYLTAQINLTDKHIHDRDVDWINECDVFIAEVTRPSLGVGYEVRTAIGMNKRILCIYRPEQTKRVSAMITGAPKVKTKPYSTIDEAKKIIDEFVI